MHGVWNFMAYHHFWILESLVRQVMLSLFHELLAEVEMLICYLISCANWWFLLYFQNNNSWISVFFTNNKLQCMFYFSLYNNLCWLVLQFIFTAMVDNCYRIATEKHGCRNMQTYLSFSRGQHRDRLVAKIVEYACSLAADQYGYASLYPFHNPITAECLGLISWLASLPFVSSNYVVQYLLSWKEPQITADILQQLEGHHFALCWCKYGSNVVEQCFKSGAEQFVKVVEELLHNPGFPVLCYHEFGNYVVQAALRCAKVRLSSICFI